MVDVNTLAEQNLNLVYKYCSIHNIFDEDMRQDLVLAYISSLDKYDEAKGALSTFVYKVLDMACIKLYNDKKKDLSSMTIESLDDEVYDGISLSETIGSDDDKLYICELKESFLNILELYKKDFPDSWETDIKVTNAVISHMNKFDIAKKYKIKFIAVMPTYLRVCKYFNKSIKEFD